jgi:hypothetical protein
MGAGVDPLTDDFDAVFARLARSSFRRAAARPKRPATERATGNIYEGCVSLGSQVEVVRLLNEVGLSPTSRRAEPKTDE